MCLKGQSSDEPRGESVSVASTSVSKVSEKEVYGPWMHANIHRRQPRKDEGWSKSMVSTGVGVGGSRFVVLSEVEGVGIGSRKSKDGVLGPASLQNDQAVTGMGALLTAGSVAFVVANGVRTASDGVVLRKVNANIPETARVVTSGGSLAPHVESHAVQNVGGSHVVMSIIDAANEKMRQGLAISGEKQALVRKNLGVGPKSGLKVWKGK
ncbi:hypothetical protein V6N11_055979 [Hibiscus sabdariffa]|uniref:Uncharacterized protein n=1 Tax=Hibiscus sabdariffa TaxID=183260 RepID=A0ABR2T3B2_9ROSI